MEQQTDEKHDGGTCPSVNLTDSPESQRLPSLSSITNKPTEDAEGNNKKRGMDETDEKRGGSHPSLRLTRRPRQEPDVPSIIDQIMDDFVANY